MKRVNLGCGRSPLDGWVNVDRLSGPGVDIVHDLDALRLPLGELPFEDDSVDVFRAWHVLEHLHHLLPLMQDCWRCARPDAQFEIAVPHGASDDADADPTHVRRFFPQSFGFFGQPNYWRADYGYRGDWRVKQVELVLDRREYAWLEGKGGRPEDMGEIAAVLASSKEVRNVVLEMRAVLEAVKPAREPRRELGEQIGILISLAGESIA